MNEAIIVDGRLELPIYSFVANKFFFTGCNYKEGLRDSVPVNNKVLVNYVPYSRMAMLAHIELQCYDMKKVPY